MSDSEVIFGPQDALFWCRAVRLQHFDRSWQRWSTFGRIFLQGISLFVLRYTLRDKNPIWRRNTSLFFTLVTWCLLNECADLSPKLWQSCYQQADIRMRSHGLRQLVDDKSVASCQQTCCKLIAKTCYPQACCKLFQQVGTSLQMTSCNKPDFNTPVATWWN